MTAVSARGALTTIDQHCQTEVLCKFGKNRRHLKFLRFEFRVVRTLLYCSDIETRVSLSEEGEPVPILKHPFSTGFGDLLSPHCYDSVLSVPA